MAQSHPQNMRKPNSMPSSKNAQSGFSKSAMPYPERMMNSKKPHPSNNPEALNSQVRINNFEVKPDLFKHQMSLEKRRGLKASALHIALARSIARSRSLLVSDEPLSRSTVSRSGSAHINNINVSSRSEDNQSAGSELTEEEGNIDDLAAAATLASAFAPQANTADSSDVSSVNRKRASSELYEEANLKVEDDMISKKTRSEERTNFVDLLNQNILYSLCSTESDEWREGFLMEYDENADVFKIRLQNGTIESYAKSQIRIKSM
jgi:hypothetical protein